METDEGDGEEDIENGDSKEKRVESCQSSIKSAQ
jgi:hypothetical protein